MAETKILGPPKQPKQSNGHTEILASETFDFKATVKVWATRGGNTDEICIWTEISFRDSNNHPVVAWGGSLPLDVPAKRYLIPREYFGSEEKIKEFIQKVRKDFENFGTSFLANEYQQYFQESVDLLKERLSLPPHRKYNETVKSVIQHHLSDTGFALRLCYGGGIPAKRSGRGRWTKEELERELREIAHALPRSERTFQKAAEELNKSNPQRKVKTGEVLRQTCNRLGVKALAFRKRGSKRN
jgi:hypothetical protein